MGSVQSEMECPRCKSEGCLTEYYYKNHEEFIFCPECGYQKIYRWKRNGEGHLCKKDDSLGYEFDNLIPEIVETENPFGAFRIMYEKGGSTGTIETEEAYHEFTRQVNELKKNGEEIRQAVVSRMIDGKIVKEIY